MSSKLKQCCQSCIAEEDEVMHFKEHIKSPSILEARSEREKEKTINVSQGYVIGSHLSQLVGSIGASRAYGRGQLVAQNRSAIEARMVTRMEGKTICEQTHCGSCMERRSATETTSPK